MTWEWNLPRVYLRLEPAVPHVCSARRGVTRVQESLVRPPRHALAEENHACSLESALDRIAFLVSVGNNKTRAKFEVGGGTVPY